MKLHRTKFNVTYKGKTYKRVIDFAQDFNLNTRLVLARWQRGWQ